MVIQKYIDDLRQVTYCNNVFDMRRLLEAKLDNFETDFEVLKREVVISKLNNMDGIIKGVCIGIIAGFLISSTTYFFVDFLIRI